MVPLRCQWTCLGFGSTGLKTASESPSIERIRHDIMSYLVFVCINRKQGFLDNPHVLGPST